MSATQLSKKIDPRARAQSPARANYGIHQTRESPPSVRVLTLPSSTRSINRAWTHRRESGTSSASEWAFTVGGSLARIASNNSSSLTVLRRPPAPIVSIHPAQVISRTDRYERQIQNITSTGWKHESRSPMRLFGAPARCSARGRLSTLVKAMQANEPRSLESTGRTGTNQHEQTYLTNFGFAPASQLRTNGLAGEDNAAGEDQEAGR